MSDQIKNCSEPIDATIKVLENCARDLMNTPRSEIPFFQKLVERMNGLHDRPESLMEEIRRQCKNLSRYAEHYHELLKESEKELTPLRIEAERLRGENIAKDEQIAHLKRLVNELGGKI